MITRTYLAIIKSIVYVIVLNLLFLPQNLFATEASKDQIKPQNNEMAESELAAQKTKPSIKKATLLSKVVKLGDILKVELEVEKSARGTYSAKLYLKDVEYNAFVGVITSNIEITEGKESYELEFIPMNIPVSSFWEEDAAPHNVYLTIDKFVKKDIGTIGLYRKGEIFRDGIIRLPGFTIPFYVVLMALLGTIGYVFTSIYKKTEFTKKNIYKWIVRVILGPLFGIFLYSIATLIDSSPNAYIIGALCFSSGFYISPIQAKMRDFIYDKLAPDKRIEDDIKELDSDEIELISRLFISKRIAYFLKKEGIVSVADLSATSDDKLKSLAESSGIGENYLLSKKNEAKDLDKESLNNLKMPVKLKIKLPRQINYIRDIVGLDVSQIGFTHEEQNMFDGYNRTAKIYDQISMIAGQKGTIDEAQTLNIFLGDKGLEGLTNEVADSISSKTSIGKAKLQSFIKP
jgi:hypothetical protein